MNRAAVRIVGVVVLVLLVGAGLPASAAPKDPGDRGKPAPKPSPSSQSLFTAPYESADYAETCRSARVWELKEECWPNAWSDGQTGDVYAFGKVHSPSYGSLPQKATNTATAWGWIEQSVAVPASSVETPFYVTFRVDDAEARRLSDRLLPGSDARGGVIVGIDSFVTAERDVVDVDAGTGVPERFTGNVVVASAIPAGEARTVRIRAGVRAEATVTRGDRGETMALVPGLVSSIQIGGAAPTPEPDPGTGTEIVYEAPFNATATTRNTRIMPRSDPEEVAGATTADPTTGEATADLATMGAEPCPLSFCVGGLGLRGQHYGASRFAFTHHVPTPSTLTVTATWEIGSAVAVHALPCVANCSFHRATVGLDVMEEDNPFDMAWDQVDFLGGTAVQTVTDGTVSVTVTVPDAQGEVTIETFINGHVYATFGASKLDYTARLVKVTIR